MTPPKSSLASRLKAEPDKTVFGKQDNICNTSFIIYQQRLPAIAGKESVDDAP